MCKQVSYGKKKNWVDLLITQIQKSVQPKVLCPLHLLTNFKNVLFSIAHPLSNLDQTDGLWTGIWHCWIPCNRLPHLHPGTAAVSICKSQAERQTHGNDVVPATSATTMMGTPIAAKDIL